MPVKTQRGRSRSKARRFREAALPYLDDVYTLARYLLRDASDAEDAVQECYLRALKHFDSYRGPAMKPWLFAILRNVCHAEYARRAHAPTAAIDDTPEAAEQTPIWQRERGKRRKPQMLRERDAGAIRRLIDALAEPFKETFVLREINNLSYREIADAVGAPVGTVMSRLARARAMLRSAWTGGRGATQDDLRRSRNPASRADRRRARRRPCARGRSPYRQLPALRRRARAPIARCSEAWPTADLRYTAPASLRQRIEASLPQPQRRASPSRRSVLRGFAMGSAVSALAATGLVAIVLRHDDQQRIALGGRLGASALAAGRPSDRRGLDRPAHGQAVVQRQARRRAAGDRPHRAGFHADRRPARLYRRPRHRRGRLQAPRST